jgi:hypothetical protein
MKWPLTRPGGLTRRPTGRMTGRPTSANGASSFHLWWVLPASGALREVEATVEIQRPPARRVLYFWALQVGFARGGRRLGAAHTGLQWHPGAPDGAVNWGGYGPGGAELDGRGGDLAPVDSDNTRHWAWQAGRQYRLRVWSPTPGAWRSTITDLVDERSVDVRDLLVDADELVEPVVWAEVFAPCDDPPTQARWSKMSALDATGVRVVPHAVRVTYQSGAEGGCVNTEARSEPEGIVAFTGLGSPRRSRHGELLPVRS